METTTRPRRINNIHRPQIYVNVEFGVSWSPRHAPNNHRISYRSRGLRDKSTNFPRQVPPPNTNYLAAPYDQYLHQQNNHHTRTRHLQDGSNNQDNQGRTDNLEQLQTSTTNNDTNANTDNTDNTQNLRRRGETRIQVSHNVAGTTTTRRTPRCGPEGHHEEEPEEFERTSRDSRASGHERGRSAPPPINDSPWDLTQPLPTGFPMGFTIVMPPPSTGAGPAQATTSSNYPGVPPIIMPPSGRSASYGNPPNPRLWKELPELPTSYRLGEAGMPWDALSWPMGYEPEADPEHALSSSYPGERRLPATFPGESSRSPPGSGAANMTYVPYSPVADIRVTSPAEERQHSQRDQRQPRSPQDTTRLQRQQQQEQQQQRTVTGLGLEEAMATPVRNHTPQRGEGRDLGALSVAMMTIDNGFEDQWWYQGPREAITVPTTPAARLDNSEAFTVSPESAEQQLRYLDFSAATLGWAIAPSTPPRRQQQQQQQDQEGNGQQQSSQSHQQHERHLSDLSNTISPMTPPPYSYAFLSRSMSARTNEAYFTGMRYA